MHVTIQLKGEAEAYFIDIFNKHGWVFKGKANQDFAGDLAGGDYTTNFKVTGRTGKKVKLKFTGVKQPDKDTERTIPKKEFFSDRKNFNV